MDEYDKMIIHHALNQRQQIAEKQHCHSFALDDRSMVSNRATPLRLNFISLFPSL